VLFFFLLVFFQKEVVVMPLAVNFV